LTTGDDHEVQKGDCGPWVPELAYGLRLERCWRQRLTEFRPFSAKFAEIKTICGSARIVFLRLQKMT